MRYASPVVVPGIVLSVVASLSGCQTTRVNPAYTKAAFGDSEAATVELATDADGGTTFSAFALDQCPNATLAEIALIASSNETAQVTIPAGKKFYFVASNLSSCPVAAGFVPTRDSFYRVRYIPLRGALCKVEVTRVTQAHGAEPEPSFDAYTRINVYGMTAKGMCPQWPK